MILDVVESVDLHAFAEEASIKGEIAEANHVYANCRDESWIYVRIRDQYIDQRPIISINKELQPQFLADHSYWDSAFIEDT